MNMSEASVLTPDSLTAQLNAAADFARARNNRPPESMPEPMPAPERPLPPRARSGELRNYWDSLAGEKPPETSIVHRFQEKLERIESLEQHVKAAPEWAKGIAARHIAEAYTSVGDAMESMGDVGDRLMVNVETWRDNAILGAIKKPVYAVGAVVESVAQRVTRLDATITKVVGSIGAEQQADDARVGLEEATRTNDQEAQLKFARQLVAAAEAKSRAENMAKEKILAAQKMTHAKELLQSVPTRQAERRKAGAEEIRTINEGAAARKSSWGERATDRLRRLLGKK